jgi:hypothetical protein
MLGGKDVRLWGGCQIASGLNLSLGARLRSLLRRTFDAKRRRSILTDPREADVGSILGWARRGRSQPSSVLAAVVGAGLVGDDDEVNVGKVRAFT